MLAWEIIVGRYYIFLFQMRRHLAPEVPLLDFYAQVRSNLVNTMPSPARVYSGEEFEALFEVRWENLEALERLRAGGARILVAMSHYSVTHFSLYFLHKLLPDCVIFAYSRSYWQGILPDHSRPQHSAGRMMLALRSGKPVMAAFDGPAGNLVLPGKLLGLDLLFARGIFAAARGAGAVVLPSCSYWLDARTIKAVFGEPIAPARVSDEDALQHCIDFVNTMHLTQGRFQFPLEWTRAYVEGVFRARIRTALRRLPTRLTRM